LQNRRGVADIHIDIDVRQSHHGDVIGKLMQIDAGGETGVNDFEDRKEP
jgi:hypothetical protein